MSPIYKDVKLPEPSYTMKQSAKLLGVSVSTVNRMRVEGKLHAFMPYGLTERGWRVKYSEIMRLLSLAVNSDEME